MSSTTQTQSYYDNYWTTGHETFSGENQGYASNFKKWMHAELRPLPFDSKLLEVGCGDGTFTKVLAQHSSAVTAIDISIRQIEQNKRRYPHITFIQHDLAEKMPFADNSFNAIWCSEVLEHIFDPIYALKEMHRILVPGGRLLVTVPYHGRFKNVLIALFNWDEHFTPTTPHIRFYTKGTLGRITREAGFTDIEMHTCGINRPVRDLFIATNILLKARKA